MRPSRAGRGALLLAALALLPGPGCSFGPKALERTHGRYAEAVRRVDEEQLLRGIVHLRYLEAPVGLDVTSIATQYELAAGAEARPFSTSQATGEMFFREFSRILPDVNVSGSNRPTITMVPSDDGTSVRRFLTPITEDTLVFLGRTGWPISTILRLWVEQVNGVANAPGSLGHRPVEEYDRFNRVAELFQVAQDRRSLSLVTEERDEVVGGPFPAAAVTPSAAVEAEAKGLRYRPADGGRSRLLVRPARRLALQVHPAAVADPEVRELYELLHLRPGLDRFPLVIAAEPPATRPTDHFTEVRLRPRSTAQVHLYLGHGVEVPPEHVAAGLVQPPLGADGQPLDGGDITRALFAVHTCAGRKPPPEAYVAVHYRGHWYYIDDRDLASKATFALVLQLSSLDFARQRLGAGPALTLPVGR